MTVSTYLSFDKGIKHRALRVERMGHSGVHLQHGGGTEQEDVEGGELHCERV